MADTTFTNGTVVTAEWLNEVNNAVFSPIYVLLNGVPTEYASLAAAVTGIGSTRCVVTVRGDVTMAASATFPATATLEVTNNARITTTGFTLTINGSFTANRAQCFAGSGTVVFGGGSVAEVYPEWWGAIGDGSTDSVTALQTCIDRVAAMGGGTVSLGNGDYRISTGIKIPDGVRLIGQGTLSTFLTKTGSGTITVGSAANTSLVCLDTLTQGSASNVFNGAIWIDDAVRAEFIEIAYMTIQSTGNAATTANAQIGIGGVGFSEGSLHHLQVQFFSKAGIVLPVTFANNPVHEVIIHKCERGLCIEAGTSCLISATYARYCHSRAFYFRDMHYCTFRALACDGLNNVTNSSDYTDRSIDSIVYMLNACTSINFQGGAEQCYGSHVYVDSCVNVSIDMEGISPASSYTGANQVALVYISQLAQNIRLNNVFFWRNGTTAVQGSATAANHHDLYVSVASNNWGFQISNFKTSNNRTDTPSAIYGNVVPSYLSLVRGSPKIVGSWTPVLNIVSGTGVSVSYGANRQGRFMVYEDGWMRVDFQLDISSVTYTGSPVYPELQGLPFDNAGAKNARLLIDQSANVTWPSTESFWVDVLPATKIGTLRNRTDATILTCPAAFASGATNVYFHGSGWIFVGDVFNTVQYGRNTPTSARRRTFWILYLV